jgi:hypothetical protein
LQKLEGILSIADKAARQRALEQYARNLRVDVGRARRLAGDFDEDVLTVLIYDALKNVQQRHSAATGLLIGAVFLTLMGVAVIFLLARLMAGLK